MELSLNGTPFHNMPPVFQKQNHTMIDMLNKCLGKPTSLRSTSWQSLSINSHLWGWKWLFTRGECKLIKVILHSIGVEKLYILHNCQIVDYCTSCFCNRWRFKFMERKCDWCSMLYCFVTKPNVTMRSISSAKLLI